MGKKIIIDTSWWISYILSKYSGQLPDFFLDEKFDLYFSTELLQEINNTLTYSRSLKRINEINFQTFIDFIEESAVIIDSTSQNNYLSRSKGQFFIGLNKRR